jgi:hypothetical protein
MTIINTPPLENLVVFLPPKDRIRIETPIPPRGERIQIVGKQARCFAAVLQNGNSVGFAQDPE